MAKSKKQLIAEAKELGIEVTEKNTIAEITALIVQSNQSSQEITEASDSSTLPEIQTPHEKTAKAGKRSTKGLKESEDKVAKVEAQKHRDEARSAETEEKPKYKQQVRSRLERRSKGYRKSAEQIEKGKNYTLTEALDLVTKTSHVKFDASVELHVRLNVDPRQADQNLRDTVVLPAGTGKTIRIAVFADMDGVAAAKKAGADIAGEDEFLQQLEKGTIDFDILISTPTNMAKLGKYARLLGPKGLMPNPKSGTVSNDVAKAVTEAKAGKVEYRVDSTGIIHLGIGKVSFGGSKLMENAQAVLSSIRANKPSGIKGSYVRSVHITSSMGPGIAVETSAI